MPALSETTSEIRVDIIVYPEAGEWVAHCLQFDLVCSAPTAEAAREDMKSLVIAHVQFAFDNGLLAGLWRPAPAECWQKLATARQSEQTTPVQPRNNAPRLDLFCYA